MLFTLFIAIPYHVVVCVVNTGFYAENSPFYDVFIKKQTNKFLLFLNHFVNPFFFDVF